MTYETLALSRDDEVLVVTLSRPEQLNAFTVQMANELVQLFTDVNADDTVRAIVVTGAGRAFCAGMDLTANGNVFGLDEAMEPTLTDLHDRFDDPAVVSGVRDTGGRVALAIFECRKPVIAAINGAAVGIGATMTLAMDVRMASERARIGFVFGRIGITPEACSTWFLPRLVGMSQALEWMYTADIHTADEAQRGGLVRSVHAPDDLLPAAIELAKRFVAGKSAVGTALTRQMMYRNAAEQHPVAAHRSVSLSMFSASTGDGTEGVQAVLDKRDPAFTSRASDMPPFYDEWTARG
ncbi:MAG: hypothetical protein RLZZ362_1882 [Actinomycetota bacterium]